MFDVVADSANSVDEIFSQTMPNLFPEQSNGGHADTDKNCSFRVILQSLSLLQNDTEKTMQR
jgi:hypothetical protein